MVLCPMLRTKFPYLSLSDRISSMIKKKNKIKWEDDFLITWFVHKSRDSKLPPCSLPSCQLDQGVALSSISPLLSDLQPRFLTVCFCFCFVFPLSRARRYQRTRVKQQGNQISFLAPNPRGPPTAAPLDRVKTISVTPEPGIGFSIDWSIQMTKKKTYLWY